MERDFEEQLRISRKYKGLPQEAVERLSEAIVKHRKKDYERFKTMDDAIAQGQRKGAKYTTAFWDGENYGAIFTYGKEKAARKRIFTAGRKLWTVFAHDDILCEFCKQLDGQIRNRDEPFIAYGSNGVKYELQGPPAHYITRGPKQGEPTCRCSVIYHDNIILPEDFEVEEEERVIFSIPLERYSEDTLIDLGMHLMDINVDFDEGEAEGKQQWFIKKADEDKVRRFLDTAGVEYEVG